jgi:hypothetical protein
LTLQRKHIYWVCGISAVIALLAVWTFAIEWEWSFIGDDVRLVQATRSSLGSGGVIQLAKDSWQYLNNDLSSFFRPVSSLYPQALYLLPPHLARGVRLLLILVSFWAVLRITLTTARPIWGNPFSLWVLSLLLANTSLYYGLWAPSLQELTGIFFLSLFLLAKNVYLKALLLILASLTKEPFIWLPLIYSFFLFRAAKERTFAIALGAFSALLITLMIFFTTQGSYVQGNLQLFNPWHWQVNLNALMTAGSLFSIILIVGLLLFRQNIKLNSESLLLGVFAVSYACSLILYSANGYFPAPVFFMITASVAFMLTLGDASKKSTLPHMGLVLVCLFVSTIWAFEFIKSEVLDKNQMVVELRDWIINVVPEQATVSLINLSVEELSFFIEEQGTNEKSESRIVEWSPEIDADFVFVGTEVPYPEQISSCEPVRVWNHGFLARLKC